MSMDKDAVLKIKEDVYATSKFEWVSQVAVNAIVRDTPEEYKKLVFELVGDEFTRKPLSEWDRNDHLNMGIIAMYEYLDNN